MGSRGRLDGVSWMQYRVRFSFLFGASNNGATEEEGHGEDGCLALLCLVIVAGAVTGVVNAAMNHQCSYQPIDWDSACVGWTSHWCVAVRAYEGKCSVG